MLLHFKPPAFNHARTALHAPDRAAGSRGGGSQPPHAAKSNKHPHPLPVGENDDTLSPTRQISSPSSPNQQQGETNPSIQTRYAPTHSNIHNNFITIGSFIPLHTPSGTSTREGGTTPCTLSRVLDPTPPPRIDDEAPRSMVNLRVSSS